MKKKDICYVEACNALIKPSNLSERESEKDREIERRRTKLFFCHQYFFSSVTSCAKIFRDFNLFLIIQRKVRNPNKKGTESKMA